MTDSITYLVDPCRFQRATRDGSKGSEGIGKHNPNVVPGDIYSSYSGDVISSKGACASLSNGKESYGAQSAWIG
jgi:hypothetical protein